METSNLAHAQSASCDAIALKFAEQKRYYAQPGLQQRFSAPKSVADYQLEQPARSRLTTAPGQRLQVDAAPQQYMPPQALQNDFLTQIVLQCIRERETEHSVGMPQECVLMDAIQELPRPRDIQIEPKLSGHNRALHLIGPELPQRNDGAQKSPTKSGDAPGSLFESTEQLCYVNVKKYTHFTHTPFTLLLKPYDPLKKLHFLLQAKTKEKDELAPSSAKLHQEWHEELGVYRLHVEFGGGEVGKTVFLVIYHNFKQRQIVLLTNEPVQDKPARARDNHPNKTEIVAFSDSPAKKPRPSTGPTLQIPSAEEVQRQLARAQKQLQNLESKISEAQQKPAASKPAILVKDLNPLSPTSPKKARVPPNSEPGASKPKPQEKQLESAVVDMDQLYRLSSPGRRHAKIRQVQADPKRDSPVKQKPVKSKLIVEDSPERGRVWKSPAASRTKTIKIKEKEHKTHFKSIQQAVQKKQITVQVKMHAVADPPKSPVQSPPSPSPNKKVSKKGVPSTIRPNRFEKPKKSFLSKPGPKIKPAVLHPLQYMSEWQEPEPIQLYVSPAQLAAKRHKKEFDRVASPHVVDAKTITTPPMKRTPALLRYQAVRAASAPNKKQQQSKPEKGKKAGGAKKSK